MDEVKEELDAARSTTKQLRIQRQLGDDENSWLEQWRYEAQIELLHEVRVRSSVARR